MRSNWFYRLFIGPQGLRSGWGLLLYVLILAVSIFGVEGAIRIYGNFNPTLVAARKQANEAMLGVQAMRPGSMLFIYGASLAVTLFAAWTMSRIEHRRVGDYGLGGSHRAQNFAKGLLSGLVLISMLVGLLWICRLLVFDGLEQAGSRLFVYGLKWFVAFCLVGLAEGYLFLGYLQYTLTRGFSAFFPKDNLFRFFGAFWSAAILLSVGFGLGHSGHQTESPVGLLNVFLFSIVSAYSLWRTGSLWWAIGMHAAWDWGQSFLFGVSDSGVSCQGRLLTAHPAGDPLLSGGSTGPEGSLFAIGIFLIGAILIRFTLPKRQYTEPFPSAIQVSSTSTNLA
jgi:uncharacterized protein